MAGALRVIHSCTSRSFSGLENYVLDLATWQKAHRKEAAIELFCRADTELSRRARTAALDTWEIPAGAKIGPGHWISAWPEWQRRVSGPAEDEIVLHLHAGGEPWYHLPWILAPGRFGGRLRKVILHYHIWINHRKRDPLHQLVFSRIDEVWTSSTSGRKHLAEILPVPERRIRVVPYGRDIASMRPLLPLPAAKRTELRTRFGVSEGDTLAVCVSRIEPIKGIGELFDAFVEVAPRHPNMHLLIIGDASPDNASAEELARSIKARHGALPPEVRSRLHLPGFIPNCNELVAAADLYVLPSYEECMSLAMLDALILGLPVLGTDAGGTPSVVRPGETGWLVPPADAPSLAATLDRALSERPAWPGLGREAARRASVFEREAIFGEIWSAYAK